MAAKLSAATIIEGGISDEGLAAMSQCEDITSQMAKELMLGIKDSVEDLSATFKRMAIVKSDDTAPKSQIKQTQNKPVQVTKPVPKNKIVARENTPNNVEFVQGSLFDLAA
jgi:hypothetical protein